MDFRKKLDRIINKNNSLLCVGLDPELEKLPSRNKYQKHPLFSFNKKIIEKTVDLVAAYKPNIAFYEAYGIDGLRELKKTIEFLKKEFPQLPIILDAKRADVPNTARMYAKSMYEYWDADATTVYPHLGLDSLAPFFEYQDKLTIVLLKTSNPDSGTFQNLMTASGPYYLAIAKEIKKWKQKQNLGIFVGATYPKELNDLRKIFPDNVFLSAGIGAQKAENQKAVQSGIDQNGSGILFNASRSIIYARNPQKAAKDLRDEINKYR